MKKKATKISIACANCGRTQTLRKSKVCKHSQYFTCSGSCKINPEWSHPHHPDGFINVGRMNAAGAFWGHEIRLATSDDQASLARAKAINAEGLRQLFERRV